MIQILDSTLREGEQTPGVYFNKHIKLAIAHLLEDIGIDIIEAGHPAVTGEIYAAVNSLAQRVKKSIVGAHARSIKYDIDLSLECGVKFIGIFYCVSDERLDTVFNKNLDEAINQISETIKYAKSKNPELLIRYTPEDTVRSQFENVVKASVAAINAGADIISIADTTGYMVSGTDRNMYDYVSRIKDAFDKNSVDAKIAVHCHNDRGMALANALDAFRAGAEIIDASVLGIGERAGIVDLAQLLTILKIDHQISRWDLSKLPELYSLVSKYSGVPIPDNFPLMGKNAFTHCAGVHTHAAAVNPMHYENINPEIFGRERHFSLDHMSGLASIKYALNLIGEDGLDRSQQLEILEVVKSIGQSGRIAELSELPHIVKYCKQHHHI